MPSYGVNFFFFGIVRVSPERALTRDTAGILHTQQCEFRSCAHSRQNWGCTEGKIPLQTPVPSCCKELVWCSSEMWAWKRQQHPCRAGSSAPIPLCQSLKCSSGRAPLIKAARGSRGISAPACSCIFKTWLCSSHRGKVQRGRTLFNMSKTRSFKIHFQTVAR